MVLPRRTAPLFLYFNCTVPVNMCVAEVAKLRRKSVKACVLRLDFYINVSSSGWMFPLLECFLFIWFCAVKAHARGMVAIAACP